MRTVIVMVLHFFHSLPRFGGFGNKLILQAFDLCVLFV
uniref:Uncharacterized protein n=1 Tax=Arundo donax TaxID=35708 RepID=A0A0A9GSN7_ARUDO